MFGDGNNEGMDKEEVVLGIRIESKNLGRWKTNSIVKYYIRQK